MRLLEAEDPPLVIDGTETEGNEGSYETWQSRGRSHPKGIRERNSSG